MPAIFTMQTKRNILLCSNTVRVRHILEKKYIIDSEIIIWCGYMLKKVLITIVCILSLAFCYQVEQRVFREQFPKEDSEPVVKKQISENAVLSENKAAKEKKIAYLTFDDGPSKNTETVLDVLKENEVHATFFLIGASITEEKADIVRRMISEGNAVGIHTYSHKQNEIYASANSYLEDFKKAYDKIYEVTGIQTKIFRFPWGSANNALGKIDKQVISALEAEGFQYYDWNVSAEDSVGTPTAESILKNIKKDYNKYNEAVVLMHDSSVNQLTAQMLPQIIKLFKDAGYEFDTLNHMEVPYQYPRD